jgi:STE24 endopeptidase
LEIDREIFAPLRVRLIAGILENSGRRVVVAVACLVAVAGVNIAFGQDIQTVPVPEPTEEAVRYYRSGIVLWLVQLAWSLVIPTLFLFTGFSARIRNWATAIGKKWFFVVGAYFLIWVVLNAMISGPLTYYAEYARQHAYGLSNQTFWAWLQDSLISVSVIAVIGILFLWIPYLLILKSPRRWWFYTGLAVIPFVFFMLFVQPIWIDPLYNEFGPMQDKELEARILALAERSGIEGSRVYEVDMSADTDLMNAYVTGFAGTHRIVLWDTIIEKLEEEELLSVMAHEMGHYVLNHVVQGIVFFSALAMVALYLMYKTTGALIRQYGASFGFTDLGDIASLPLLVLLINLFGVVVTPLALAFSRYQEHEADRFSLELTQNNVAAAQAFVVLTEENLGYPRPGALMKLWRSTHPPLGERIDFANTYRPWDSGEPLVYGDRFKEP